MLTDHFRILSRSGIYLLYPLQFFTATNEDFDPSGMFHIFDGYNFYEIQMHIDKLTPE